MSSASDTRSSALDIINAVLCKMGESPLAAFDETRYGLTLLQLLNETLSNLDDYGNWEEAYESVDITPVVGQMEYNISTDDPVRSIEQVFWKVNRGALKKISKAEMNYMTMREVNGIPSFWTIYGVNANNNPLLKVYPAPYSVSPDDRITVFYYKKTPLLSVGDEAIVPIFPANVIIKGLYVMALLEQNDGEPTAPIQAAQADYENARREAHNRYTNDSGRTLRLVPANWFGGRW